MNTALLRYLGQFALQGNAMAAFYVLCVMDTTPTTARSEASLTQEKRDAIVSRLESVAFAA